MELKIACDNQGDVSAVKLSIAAELAQIQCSYQKSLLKISDAILITQEGVSLPSSIGIKYLARLRPDLALYGRSFIEAALVDKMLKEIETRVLLPIETAIRTEGRTMSESSKDIEEFLIETVAPHLNDYTFLVGERLSIADIDLAISLSSALAMKIASFSLAVKYPSIQRWITLILSHPAVTKHFKPSQIKALKTKPVSSDAGKKQIKTVTEKKPEPPKTVDDEQEEPSTKKQTNPLQLLPPTNFVLDEWKREYSNSKDLKSSMKWFWDRFDQEGWSLWYIRYEKEEGENKIGYITANLLGGFLQRIEPTFRQYSFGVMNVVGETGNFDIQGVWLIRGSSLPHEITDHVSYDYYQFKKLSPLTQPSDKQLIEDYWCNDESVENRRIDSCKVWK